MQGDVSRIVAAAGLPIQPSQYPLLATLDRDGPMTIGQLVEAMGLSQPAVTRILARLAALDLVTIARIGRDQRQKTVTLSAQGTDMIARSKRDVWPRVESAVVDLCAGLTGPLIDQIAAIEAALLATPLDKRGAGLVIRPFSDALAGDFHDINAEWIDTMFRMEETDRDVLRNPRARIIDAGGTILFVEAAGLGIVGACALQKTGEHQFELTKMGVRPSAQGRKAGEFLLAAIIAKAEAMGAETLYLLTNAICAPAIHLYEKLGFVHDAAIMRDFGARYARCDVAMRYRPQSVSERAVCVDR
ncbi:MAG: MarR family transcriptional regulator [Sphingomonas sp. 28-63-12]|nr:MAG: MarR family transcriptional regulator [Sphingomonas sp. 28-63-12]